MRLLFVTLLVMLPQFLSAAEDASAIVRAAVDHYRGSTSTGEISMIIHRPDWERSMSMTLWTAGDDRSLVRVLEPIRDAGNGTLSLDGNMWTYTPKINRIIKIPASLMNQNWMGSDFSNRDVARNDDIVDQYDHRLLETREEDGRKIFTIESVPLPEAAVVWGREVLTIRDDWVMLQHAFYDQDGELVKALKTLEIRMLSDRPVATIMRMTKADEPGEWTEMHTKTIAFDVALRDGLFTLSNLRNPRK